MSRQDLVRTLRDEMAERGWDKWDVACRAMIKDPAIKRELSVKVAVLEMLFGVPEATFGEEDATFLGDAFGVSKEFFLNLENAP